MCSPYCIVFGVINLRQGEIEGKRILEIGSCDVNGSLRPIIELQKPAEYIGVDVVEGPGVDMICNAEDILKRFGKESFDVVVSTELLEHVRGWRKVISNIKNICKVGGVMLITTRSRGFDYHGFPYDFWRYEAEDMKNIFSDCTIERLEKDKSVPGIFMKVKKPNDFAEKDLSRYELYSVIVNRRIKELEERDFRYFKKKYLRRQFLKEKAVKLLYKIYRSIFSKI
ncbi:MAG: methyltransferase domain-containing protein [Candidatus Omnitrophota bacterium]|nr:MAG: methyltransferase domain-containing protein [Candidatus Omnitrophota bacterium]